MASFGAGDVPAAEADEIRIAGMCAYRDARRLAGRDGLVHDERIARMIAAGHVRRGNVSDDSLVHADGVRTEAFAQVTVQINLVHVYTSFEKYAAAQ